MRALIVDDSRAIRAVLARVLKDLGMEVAEAGDHGEAMAALTAHHDIQVVLLDWNLPGKSGFEILCEIRANAAWSSIAVIMCTTESDTAQVNRALEAGANEYVMKPFSRLVIVEKLGLCGLTRKV
jgi:two-component system, chemotaxis family, chemotaxis protein CheY